MKLEKIFLLAFVLFPFLAACGAIQAGTVLVSVPKDGTPQATPQQIFFDSLPASALEPEIPVTPTANTMATTQAESISAEKTHDAAQLQIAYEGTDVKNSENTSVARTAVHEQETLTAAPKKTDAAKTEVAKTESANGTAVTLELMHATQTLEAPGLIVAVAKAQAEADNAPVRAWVAAWGPILSYLVIALFILAGAWVALARINVSANDRETLPADPPADPVTNYVTETPGGFQHIERVPPPPGGINDQWLRWAHLARMGHSVAYNKMTGEGLPYKNSADYAPVYQWAWRNKIIGRDVKGVTVLTARGEQHLDAELIRAQYHAPAPDVNETQIMPPTNHAQDYPAHDPGGGVGPEQNTPVL